MNTRRIVFALVALLVATIPLTSQADEKTDKAIKDLRKRIQKLEVAEAKDRIDFTGDLRVEAHTITGEISDYFDGLALQQALVNTLAYNQIVGGPPLDANGFNYGLVQTAFADPANYGAYMMFLNNLQFSDIPGLQQDLLVAFAAAMSGDPGNFDPSTLTPADFANLQNQAMQALMQVPGVFKKGYDIDNSILYTTRLRLNMHAKVSDDIVFDGRLAMYKPWGASTQIPIFNGQPNSIALDVSSPGVPSSEQVRVERAYFSWRDLFGSGAYLSLGRRPSTGGLPLNFRHDELRAGTPLGTVIDMQFDGATLGWNFFDRKAIVRACYGIGFESQFGNGSILSAPADRLKDASFFGFNFDVWNTEEMQVQATVARAFNLTDGFNGYVIMPTNPVTGMPMPGPIVTRFSPSSNLGDFDLASALVARSDGPVDWFASASWSKSRPEDGVTTPFGGIFADPFEAPQEESGHMFYLGARYNLTDDKTKVGLEYNKGSEFWFNFAPAADDIIAPKTSTRGSVYEAYVTHRVARRFILKLDWIHYDYDYTGSGWQLGRPKEIGGDVAPISGYPTYESADKLSLSFIARF